MNDVRNSGLIGGKKAKIKSLEGLRGVAAMIVVFSHLKITFFSNLHLSAAGVAGDLGNRFLGGLTNGFFSVWLFWLMSGFVLSLKIHSERDPVLAIARVREATIKRYPRLLPPVLVSVLIAWLLLVSGLMSNELLGKALQLSESGWPRQFFRFESSLMGALKGGAWQAFFIYDPSRSYNPVLWTMEKEFYGSIFLFGGLAVFGKWRFRGWAYLLTVVVNHKLGLNWLNSFVIGGLLCDIYVNAEKVRYRYGALAEELSKIFRPRVVTSILFVVVVLAMVGPPEKGSDVIYLLSATAMTAFVVWDANASRFLGASIFVFLGKISFGVYLMHLPVIFSIGHPIYQFCSVSVPGEGAKALACIALTGLSLVAGWGLWYVADRPVVALISRLSAAGGFNAWAESLKRVAGRTKVD
jgi:peptidoglycan/LPS O-acetylase OafA/YrhL